MEDVGDNNGEMKGVSAGGSGGSGVRGVGGSNVGKGPNYGVLFFVLAGVIVLAVGVFFLFGWIGDALNGVEGSGSGSEDVDGGDGGAVDYSQCEGKDAITFVKCVVSIGVFAGEEVCVDDSIEWPEMPSTNDGQEVDTVDYCWVSMATKKEDIAYCDNIDGEYLLGVCEDSFGGGV